MRSRGQTIAALALTTVLVGPLRLFSGEASLRRLDGVNASPRLIREAYVARSTERDWGANRLQGRTLAPGASISLEISGGCGPYDVRFVADAGVELEAEEVELCPADGSWLVIVLRKKGLEITTGAARAAGQGQ